MKCFYHNDLDGRCAAAIVAYYTGDYNKENYFEVDYVKPLPLDKITPNETVYLVDYSLKENTFREVIDPLVNRNCDIIWIDHHTSSINLGEELPKSRGITYFLNEDYSGAALTYMYLYKCEYEDIPYFVKLVDDYDCWKFHEEPNTSYFKLGIETTNYDALDNMWELLFSTSIIDSGIFSNLINSGKIIKDYIDKDNRMYRDNYEYEIELCGYPCKVVNKKSNSWIFGEHYYEYPIVMVWVFDGENFVHSIFSNDKNVDCSKIAESYCGGGHKGAAGFSSKELLFRNGGVYGYGNSKK